MKNAVIRERLESEIVVKKQSVSGLSLCLYVKVDKIVRDGGTIEQWTFYSPIQW